MAGGMGSAVAECLGEFYPTKILFMGIKDQFGQSEKPRELEKYYKSTFLNQLKIYLIKH